MGLWHDLVKAGGAIFSPDPENTSTTVPNAGMSPEERHLYDVLSGLLTKQSSNLDQQMGEYNAMKPQLTSMVNDLDVSGKEINDAFAGRTLAALRGESPTDPTLLRQMQLGDIDLDNQLRRDLGTGYATSTPGIQAGNDWRQRKLEAVYGDQQNQLQNSFSNYMTGTGNLFSRALQKAGALSSISTGGLPFLSAGNSLTNSISAPLQTLMQHQLGDSGVQEKYFKDKMDYRGGLFKGVASLFGGMMGGG